MAGKKLSKDVLAEMQADATAAAGEGDLATIAKHVQQALDLEAEIESLEQLVKQRKAELLKLRNHEIVDAMDAAGCAEFTHAGSGRKVSVKDIVSASITKANEAKAFAYLRKLGQDDLIKHQLTVSFDRKQGNLVAPAEALLKEELGLEPQTKASVHPQTLSAWCREQMAKGNALDADILGLHAARQAVIK